MNVAFHVVNSDMEPLDHDFVSLLRNHVPQNKEMYWKWLSVGKWRNETLERMQIAASRINAATDIPMHIAIAVDENDKESMFLVWADVKGQKTSARDLVTS